MLDTQTEFGVNYVRITKLDDITIFYHHICIISEGWPGAAVEPTVYKWRVRAPASVHLCRTGLVLKTTLAQTPCSAGSLRHWVHFFLYICIISDKRLARNILF